MSRFENGTRTPKSAGAIGSLVVVMARVSGRRAAGDFSPLIQGRFHDPEGSTPGQSRSRWGASGQDRRHRPDDLETQPTDRRGRDQQAADSQDDAEYREKIQGKQGLDHPAEIVVTANAPDLLVGDAAGVLMVDCRDNSHRQDVRARKPGPVIGPGSTEVGAVLPRGRRSLGAKNPRSAALGGTDGLNPLFAELVQ